MGREFHEYSDDVEFESYHPGCMQGIFNVLDYHHWNNVKKMFAHRKCIRGRNARCCANPKTMSMEREAGGTQRFLDGEAGHIQVQQRTRKTGSTNKSSGKAYTKGLTAKEKSKEENHKHWILGFLARSQLQQTNSTHHLQPSGFGLGYLNPVILVRKRANNSETSLTSYMSEFLRKQVTKSKKSDIRDRVNADSQLEHKEIEKHTLFQKKFDKKGGTRTLINQKPMAKKLNISDNQVNEGLDVLEIFKVSKNLFLDILQDTEVGISQQFPGKPTSKTVRLTKSGSFPISGSARTRYLRSRTLEHKQKEVWSFRKGEKSCTNTQLSKSRVLRTDDSFRNILTEEASSSSPGSDSPRWNHLVMNHLKDIKQRIKQALRERRKSINHTMVDGLTLQVSSRDALSTYEREMSESLEKTTVEQHGIDDFNSSYQTNASGRDPRNGRLNRIRRTKSINESLDRYTQLFEHSVSKEANLLHSKSLKLTNEDKVQSRVFAPKFFRRISSLSDLDSFCSLLHGVSREALSSEMPIRTVVNYDANKESAGHNEPKSISFPQDIDKFELVEAVLEAQSQEKLIEGNNHSSTGFLGDRNREEIAKPFDFDEDMVELEMEKRSPHVEQENVCAVNPSIEITQPTLDSDDITSWAEHPISEGLELNHPINLHEDEAESFTILKDRCTISHEYLEHETVGISSRFLFFESEKEADPCYTYVRDVLALSGFIQNEYLQTWCLPDHPLNPSLFKELEILLHPEMECSIEEVGSNCDHQLVFDLVNEALLEITEKPYIYFPNPYFFNRRLGPMLKGNNVLQEVWTKVSKNLASQPETDQSLDDIVAPDFAKDASWMNLQAEAEFVALELEELVFDELLDEVLFLCDSGLGQIDCFLI